MFSMLINRYLTFNVFFLFLAAAQESYLPVQSNIADNVETINTMQSGVNMLVYVMAAWLGLVTVAAVAIFLVVYVRLSRASQALDDAEARSTKQKKVAEMSTACNIDCQQQTETKVRLSADCETVTARPSV